MLNDATEGLSELCSRVSVLPRCHSCWVQGPAPIANNLSSYISSCVRLLSRSRYRYCNSVLLGGTSVIMGIFGAQSWKGRVIINSRKARNCVLQEIGSGCMFSHFQLEVE